MDRRDFLKVTGLAAAASALNVLPAAAQGRLDVGEPLLAAAAASPRLSVAEPGTYRISGWVELHQPRVEISGITNAHWISGSRFGGPNPPLASFLTFERFDQPGFVPDIRVLGGRLGAVSIVPVELE